MSLLPTEPTEEQCQIIERFQDKAATIIEAGPGCGKSTTIGLMARELSHQDRTASLCLAFNKDITLSLEKKVPNTLPVRTFNSFGQETWASYIGTGVQVQTTKSSGLLRAIQQDGKWSIASEEVSDLKTLISMAKSLGYLPKGTGSALKSFIDFPTLCATADLRPYPHWHSMLDQILALSIQAAFKRMIDFDDQLYMPVFFAPSSNFPEKAFIFIDEAQDLSPIQLRFIKRLKPAKAIFVGDPMQAIYAFRGAMSDSMEQIRNEWPEHQILPLQTSFRLPTKIVGLLQDHNPALKPGKPSQGHLETLEGTFSLEQLDNASFGKSRAILCRNNAPLFRVALACLASRCRFHIANPNFGRGLIADIRRACTAARSQEAKALVQVMYRYWYRSGMDVKDLDLLADKAATLEILSTGCTSALDVINLIESLLRTQNLSDSSKPFVLSTGHKAKGLEFEWVLHLDPGLIPAKFASSPEELLQEKNIAYVINSRSLETLLFANSGQIVIPGAAKIRSRPDLRQDQPV